MILLICVLVFAVLLVLLMIWGGGVSGLSNFADFTSLFAVIILPIIMLLGSGYIKDFFKAFNIASHRETSFLESELKRAREAVSFAIKSVLLSGAICTVVGFISIGGNIISNGAVGQAALMRNLGVAFIALLYSLIIAFLMLPLRAQAERRLADRCDK